MNIYVVSTCSYDFGEMLKAFKTKEAAESFRDSISIQEENGPDICYIYKADAFYHVYIDGVELV